MKKEVNLSSFIFQRYEMVKFEKLEAIGKTGEEENFAEDRRVSRRVGKRNIRRGDERNSRIEKKQRRDKRKRDTDTDNEKMSTVKKEAGSGREKERGGGGERKGLEERRV